MCNNAISFSNHLISYVPCLYDMVVTYNSTLKWKSNTTDCRLQDENDCALLFTWIFECKKFHCTMLVPKQKKNHT